MKQLLLSATVSLILLLSCSASKKPLLDEVELSEAEKAQTFAIMPFEEPETYPYASDRMREALIIAFMEKGYYVETNEALWDSLSGQLDYHLYNLNEEQAKEVARNLKIDMLIFGQADFRSGISSTRPDGLYQQKVIERPIVIKAYDLSSDKILLRERIPTRSDWGLDHSEKDVRQIALEFINKLKSMGYIR